MQIKRGYAEGGFLDDGATVDPMSGNEVPVGSLQEEVRDDIPAQLSEGEFVVPADVVRFIGLDKLMKMRDSAKKGLASMEAEGQIGGSPAPQEMPPEMGMGAMQEEAMDIDAMIDGMEDDGMDGSDMGFAEGGDVSTYASLMGHEFGSVPTLENAVFINADGHKVYIPIVDGEPSYAPPEGYTLVVAEEDEAADVETPEEELEEAAAATNPNVLSAHEKAQNARDITSSNKLQRDHISKLERMAGSDMTESELTTMYGHLSTKAKGIYDDRFRETKGLDSLMAKGKSPVDLMIEAQKTANTLNNKAGIVEYNDTDTYDVDGTNLTHFAKVSAAALLGGIPGLLSVADIKKKGIDDPGIVATIKKYVRTFGEDSGRTGDSGIQPIGEKAKVYDQAYWRKRLGENATQAEMAAEQAALHATTGLNAYGNSLTAAEITAANKLKSRNRDADKKQRTIDKMIADAKMKDDLMDQYSLMGDRGTSPVEEAVEVITGSDSTGGNPFNYKDAEAAATKIGAYSQERALATGNGYATQGEIEREEEQDHARGGLVSKKKPKVKKMRSDNTSGLAAKKKSKERAKAKKGALAAKRT